MLLYIVHCVCVCVEANSKRRSSKNDSKNYDTFVYCLAFWEINETSKAALSLVSEAKNTSPNKL